VIVVAGENVVDLIPQPDGALRPALGGGPANIAVAAVRLGAPVAMATRLGGDTFGAAFGRRLAQAGVDQRYLRSTADPSTLALATIASDGGAHFDFWLTGAADFGWRDEELPDLPGGILHLGSLAAFLPPGADALERWAVRHRPLCTVTFDPNLRPIVLTDRVAGIARLERLVRVAHVVKVSEDDLRLGYPQVRPEETARRWLRDLGTGLVLVTRGAAGITAFTPDGEVSRPAPRVSVVDTIGAGDAAMGALLVALHRDRAADLVSTLDYVCAVAALACTRPGAYAPTGSEVAAFMNKSQPNKS
jgi:fructokinase